MSGLQVLIGQSPMSRLFNMTMLDGRLKIVNDHRVQAPYAIGRFQQFAAKFSRTDHGYVFVFSYGFDFIGVEIAEIKAIFQTKH